MSSSSSGPQAPASAPDLEILGDQVTLHPGQNRPGSPGPERNLVEHMSRFRESPLEFLREVSLHISGTGWRAYDDVIGQPIFYRGFSENMINKTMQTQLLQDKIQELVKRRLSEEERSGILGSTLPITDKNLRQRKEELLKNLEDVVREMLDNMICKMESKHFIRGAYYVATALLTRAYHQGIHVSSEEVLRLRTVARDAAEKGLPIIFLPCHRSHVDYVSLQLICYRLGMALPTVVAGDNLGFIGLKQFLQNAGAMWIRRSFAGDALYGTVVQSYIETLMRGGFHLEAFIEGGRSRTGKLLPPKFGILSYVLDAVMSGRVKDAIICPVSTQYDKVIETESYISELLGRPKKKENVYDFLNSSSVLSLKLGRVDVRFHEPWSLKAWIGEQQARMDGQKSNTQVGSVPSRVRLLRTMGYRVLSDINEVSVVMPTALVGTVLLTLRGRGVGKSELIRRVEWLSDRVRAKGGRVAHFYEVPVGVVIDRAIEVLGSGLVGRIDDVAEETYFAVDRFQLSFYRNMTIHLFVSEALLCAGMYTQVKKGGGPANQKISYDELYNQVSFLSQLFQTEFIFPIEGLQKNLHKTLAGLETDSVIVLSRDNDGIVTGAELSATERAHGRENFDFYTFMIWPFVEASWLAAVSLMALTPLKEASNDTWVELKKAQDMAQLLGKTLYHQGDLSYYEAVNKEVLSRSYDRFVDEGIISIAKSRESAVPVKMQLSPTWTPERDEDGSIMPQGKLWDFIEMIAKSRREGKNRRDNATVSVRVLGLADRMGRELFAVPTSPVSSMDIKSTKRPPRRAIQASPPFVPLSTFTSYKSSDIHGNYASNARLPLLNLLASSNNNNLTITISMRNPPKPSTYPPRSDPPLPSFTTAAKMQDDLFSPPLHTSGRYIHDSTSQRFKLCSVNWYGGSDELFIPSGLDVRHRTHIASTIRSMGFNSVRLPYSDELVLSNPLIPAHLLTANTDLQGKRGLDIFEAVVTALTDAGLAVIVNNHITGAGWCDGKNLCDAGWRNDNLGPFCRVKQTEEQWISHWLTLMTRLKGNPRVIGCDLRNEPRGLWGTTSWGSWARAATRCADRLHEINEDWLMFVEGTSSANDCSGARTEPVVLRVPNKVVYSVHVFAWSGWGDMNPFSRRPYPGFALQMQKNWAFLLDEGVAPVWVGEMGAPSVAGKGDRHYWESLMRYLKFVDVDFGYWAINPRKPHANELESWSLVGDDWETVVDDYRMEGMRALMPEREKGRGKEGKEGREGVEFRA